MMQEFKLKWPSKVSLLRWTLDSLYYSQLFRFFEPGFSGVGAIFTLHHVVPNRKHRGFAPNRILEVTPEFLEQTIKHVHALDYDIVSLDEVRRRLLEKDFKRKFVCFTLDDGYVDNYEIAFPVFKKYNAEFTIFLTTGLPDGTVLLWWQGLEQLLMKEEQVDVELAGEKLSFVTISTAEKNKAYNHIYWRFRALPIEEQYVTAKELFDKYDIDSADLCRKSAMTWDMLAEIAQSELATIAVHTINHFPLNKLPSEKVYEEASVSRDIIARRLNVNPTHFAYPYGDNKSATSREFKIIKKLAFDTATTTRRGVLFPEHAQHLQALPRISLNGDYQKQRYVRVFLSGAPFAILNRFRKIDVN